MNRHAKRQLFSGVLFLTGIALAQSLALAACPPPSSGSTTVTVLSPCCDYGLALKPCGVDPNRIELTAPLVTPSITTTPDPDNPCKVHVTTSGGSMTVTGYGACIGLLCDAGPKYDWTPFRSDSVIGTSSLSWARNYPSSAWIGGDPNYVNLTSLTPAQRSMTATWSMGNNSFINIPGQVETFSLGCTAVIPKPTPIPACTTCPPSLTPSSKSCQGGEMDPVDPYSGDYYYAEEDLTVPGIIPLKVVRAYTSSQIGLTGPFGVGTYLKGYNYQIGVPLNGDGTVNTSANQTIQFDDGSGLLLPFSNGSSGGLTFANNNEVGTAGSALVLTLDGTNHLASAVYTLPDKTKLHFDADGRLSTLEDSNGNTVALTRGTGGRLEGISLLGRSLTLAYNGAGLIESIADHTGRTVRYFYSSNNELLRVRNVAEDDQTYTWDSAHRIQTLVDFSYNLRFLNAYAPNGMIGNGRIKTYHF